MKGNAYEQRIKECFKQYIDKYKNEKYRKERNQVIYPFITKELDLIKSLDNQSTPSAIANQMKQIQEENEERMSETVLKAQQLFLMNENELQLSTKEILQHSKNHRICHCLSP